MKKYLLFIILFITSIIIFTGCKNNNNQDTKINQYINLDIKSLEVVVGNKFLLNFDISKDISKDNIEIIYDKEILSINKDFTATAIKKGNTTIYLKYNNILSNKIDVLVFEKPSNKPVSDTPDNLELSIDRSEIMENNFATLLFTQNPDTKIQILKGSEYVRLEDNKLFFVKEGGVVEIVLINGNKISNKAVLQTVSNKIVLSSNKTTGYKGDSITLTSITTYLDNINPIKYKIIEGFQYATLNNNILNINESNKKILVQASIGSSLSNIITINKDAKPNIDYSTINKDDFYKNYFPATSNDDAKLRSQYGILSGSIEIEDEFATISKNQPQKNNILLRNSNYRFSPDKNTYYVVDSNNNIVNTIYKDGGYTILEDVAAYVFAFGTTPKNYTSSKSTKPSKSVWKKDLRLNHSFFSGDVKNYPFEPKLPNIKGNGGEIYYYEIDIATTGTTSDPKYPPKLYNTGSVINRGAARIVYTRYDKNRNDITNLDNRIVFYTHNHYNDFREYLNYYNGWGKIFGNITGGGKISSRTNYNPTEYIKVELFNFDNLETLSFDNFKNIFIYRKEENIDLFN